MARMVMLVVVVVLTVDVIIDDDDDDDDEDYVLGERLAPAAAPRLLAAVAGLRLSLGVDATPSDMHLGRRLLFHVWRFRLCAHARCFESLRVCKSILLIHPIANMLNAVKHRKVLTRISLLFAALVSHLVTNEGEQQLTAEVPPASYKNCRDRWQPRRPRGFGAGAPGGTGSESRKRELELQLEQLKEDAGAGLAAAARAARLVRVLEAARRREAALGKEVQELDETVLFLRLRDAAPSIRRCYEQKADPQ
ncbi:hypothetical protein AK812_SmicGene3916 [Symbiodinium microadriaticum]|uniref:Uncharacterized protein n=1 Tax=Symbiodinium microadriaticum TaxID=2951 RepID=A0A1Q9EXQ6_SYMMI|nr:hypothetical protein AK812_SmicGene3916 [Symbiodinium microadriaticum]